ARCSNVPIAGSHQRSFNMLKIADLGCGENHLVVQDAEVVRVDKRAEVLPDRLLDLRYLRALDYGTFDEVRSSHTLEHFSREEVPAVLDEWIRLLKPRGKLVLVVPDLRWAAIRILRDEISLDAGEQNMVMNVLYGAQTYELNYHKVG